LHVAEDVIAYARPHELDIVVDGDAREGVPASVRRVLLSGAVARVEQVAAARNVTPCGGPLQGAPFPPFKSGSCG
jgi:hypothetical protein